MECSFIPVVAAKWLGGRRVDEWNELPSKQKQNNNVTKARCQQPMISFVGTTNQGRVDPSPSWSAPNGKLLEVDLCMFGTVGEIRTFGCCCL